VPLVTLSQDYALDQLGSNKLLYASLHTAYSGTGTNEVSGGGYARQAATWSSAAGSSKALTTTLPSFSVPASTTVEFVGFWDAVSSGNFQGMFPNGGASAYTFSAPGSTSTFLAPGSGYSNTQQVVIFATAGATLPGGFTAGTIYYVVSASSDSFKLSATSGGGSITVTSDGSGIVQAITPETFGGAGTFSLTSGSVSLT
jgi:hypothetical protein